MSEGSYIKRGSAECACFALFLFGIWAACCNGQAVTHVDTMRSEFEKKKFSSVIGIFEKQVNINDQNDLCMYLAGYAWLKVHVPDRAKELLIRVSDRFAVGTGWDSPQSLLRRIEQIENDSPPLLLNLKDGKGAHIRLFAKRTEWAIPVIDALGRFRARALEIFGEEAPAVDLYIFEKRSAFERFHRNIFETESKIPWQDGTGLINIALFCEENKDGQTARLGNSSNLRIGDVFHEYGHALLSTYYGDGYLNSVPAWLNEGLSDYIAQEFRPWAIDGSRKLLKDRKGSIPSYRDLANKFYTIDPDVSGALARLMVVVLIENLDSKVIKRILDAARSQGDFRGALKLVTGHYGLWAYRKVLQDSIGSEQQPPNKM
jgi:hypothetical protein